MFPTFHTSQVRPFVENDKELFPGCKSEEPPPVFVNDKEEFLWNVFWTNGKEVRECNIWYVGSVMGQRRIIGCRDVNSTNVKPSTSGWRKGN
jgi:hypothetical protein